LWVICPGCGYKIKYKSGKIKNPRIKEVDEYLDRAQCPDCGRMLRIKKK
jgi:hypothetical protein